MPYRIIPVTPFEQNCTLIWCPDTREAAVVDPGGDLDRIRAAVAAAGVTLKQILLTHAHIDHAGGVAELAAADGLPIVGPHPGDQFWIDGLGQQARMFGFREAKSFTPDRWLGQGDTVQVGRLTFEVRHCPGHTPGHVVFHVPAENLAIVGDVLFAGSIGRTDFPGGDYDTLVNAIRTQLFTLGDDVRFIPGHGPMSTIGEERRSNPFVADKKFG
ncbi:MAG: Zn-dependent hydrolase, glyoxylase [Moraxellaceae bacterium]|jgi:glyoxylase-like metal-dependent hydrolase (beta-lactamase superfamily II)|nr:Zn-dependent hydrolase, glyoxylase [Moraxellaceae bacterium]